MQVIEWANKLGYDIHGLACAVEVMRHKDCFSVRTFDIHSTKQLDQSKCLRVPYDVTDNPITAATLCHEQGLLVRELEDLDPHDAELIYQKTLPTQQEMF